MDRVPDTDTFKLTDVTTIVGGSGLSAAFTNSTDSKFDPRYKGSKDRLSNFRNYGLAGDLTLKDTDSYNIIGTYVNSMASSPDATYYYAIDRFSAIKNIKAFSVNPTTGVITLEGTYNIPGNYTPQSICVVHDHQIFFTALNTSYSTIVYSVSFNGSVFTYISSVILNYASIGENFVGGEIATNDDYLYIAGTPTSGDNKICSILVNTSSGVLSNPSVAYDAGAPIYSMAVSKNNNMLYVFATSSSSSTVKACVLSSFGDVTYQGQYTSLVSDVYYHLETDQYESVFIGSNSYLYHLKCSSSGTFTYKDRITYSGGEIEWSETYKILICIVTTIIVSLRLDANDDFVNEGIASLPSGADNFVNLTANNADPICFTSLFTASNTHWSCTYLMS